MLPWTELMRSWLKPAPRRGTARKSRRLIVETLETRDTPSITTEATLVSLAPPPTWQPLGPTSIEGSANSLLGNPVGNPTENLQVGAVESISVDPFNAKRVVVGAVNGGVWVTNDITAVKPVWTTTTDNLPSLAISTVAFSPTLANVIYAGTGSYSVGGLGPNFSATTTSQGDGGAPGFLYKSTNGGQSWSVVGGDTFLRLRIRNILPTAINGGQTLFASVTEDRLGGPAFGIYRSNDGGTTWDRLETTTSGIPTLGVTSLIQDPANPNRVIAAFVGTASSGPKAGVYALDTTGGNTVWTNLTSDPLFTAAQTADRILLAATPAGAKPLYAAVIGPSGNATGVYRGVTFGSSYIWTAIGPGGLPPDVNRGQQADIHYAIVADPTTDRYVYVGGDRRDPFPYAANAARGDYITDTWTTLTAPSTGVVAQPGTTLPLPGSPTPTTAPHADLRWMTFDGPDKVLVGSDGGIYQMINPRPGNPLPPTWSALTGNLQISEAYAGALDNRNTVTTADDVYLIAAQDNGENEVLPGGGPWKEVQTGDGTIVMTDTTSDPTGSYRYYGSQFFFLSRRNPDGTLVRPAATVAGTGGGTINPAAPGALVENLPYLTAAALSKTSPRRMLVGGTGTLYLSEDRADTFTGINGPAAQVPNINGTVQSISFGTTQLPYAAYVAVFDTTTGVRQIARSFDVSVGNGGFVLTDFDKIDAVDGPVSVVMDPNNPLLAYAITNNNVYRTTNGLNWVKITANLGTLTTRNGRTTLAALDLVNRGTIDPTDDVLLVGGYGGVFSLQLGQTTPTWMKVGVGMPNVVVSDLDYDPLSDTLLASTYGRGSWLATNVNNSLIVGKTVIVTGNPLANTMWIVGDTVNTQFYTVGDGLGNEMTFNSTEYLGVTFRGLPGADTVIVGAKDATTPGVTWPLQVVITVEGGDPGDRLIVNDAADTTGRQTTLTASQVGGGKGDTMLRNSGRVKYTGLDGGSVEIRMGTAAGQTDTLLFDDTATKSLATYTLGKTQLTRSLGGVYNYSGVEQMAVAGGTSFNTYRINATGATVGTTVNDSGGNGTFVIQGDGLTGTTAFNGNGGDDSFTVNAGSAINATVQIAGGDGNDSGTVVGRTTPDAVVLSILGGGAAGISGLGQTVGFTSMEVVGYAGNGGNDALTWRDDTNGAYGTPINPASGIAVIPTAASAGKVVINGGGVLPVATFSGVPNVTINGDPDGSGDKDVLLVTGTSTDGLGSAFGETTAKDGSDSVYVSDSQVRVTNSSNGPSLTVSPVTNTFATVYVFTGNESGSNGDLVTAVPSTAVNLLVDGGGPTRAPGDKITVQAPGPLDSVPVNDPNLGPPQTRVTDLPTGAAVGIIGFENNSASVAAGKSSGLIVVGTDAGSIARVQAYDRLTGAFRFEFVPFENFTGGVSVASGDLNGDGVTDIVVGAGPGGGPRISAFNGVDGSLMFDFFAYEDTFRGGVNVSVADMNNDGAADIITGTGVGGGPRVRVFNGLTLDPLMDAFVYESTFRGGVNVATGDFSGDGIPDLITSAGFGGGPRVVVLDGKSLAQIASFFAFDPSLRNGFYISSGDVNGDGIADIIAGSGPGVPAEVRVFNGKGGTLLTDFFINDPFNPNGVPNIVKDVGVRVASADVDGDGVSDIITGKGPGSLPVIRMYGLGAVNPLTNALTTNLRQIRDLSVFEADYGYGLFVGANG